MNIFRLSRDNLRINLIILFVLILFAFLGYRLVNLQLLNRGMWRALAQGQQTFFTQARGSRGEIYFQGKERLVPAAVNKPSTFCFASPQKVEDKKKTANSLSGILDLEKEEIIERLGKGGQFAPLQHNLSEKRRIKSKRWSWTESSYGKNNRELTRRGNWLPRYSVFWIPKGTVNTDWKSITMNG